MSYSGGKQHTAVAPAPLQPKIDAFAYDNMQIALQQVNNEIIAACTSAWLRHYVNSIAGQTWPQFKNTPLH